MNTEPFADVDPALAFTAPTPRNHASAGLPRRRYFIIATVFTILLHAYALAVLPSVMEVEFRPDQTEANLENDEIGNDPDLLPIYRISIGPINPNQPVGTLNAPDGPPPTLPPPTPSRSRLTRGGNLP
jgi:hypothetical protein